MVAYLLDSHTEPGRTFAAQLEPEAARKTVLEATIMKHNIAHENFSHMDFNLKR